MHDRKLERLKLSNPSTGTRTHEKWTTSEGLPLLQSSGGGGARYRWKVPAVLGLGDNDLNTNRISLMEKELYFELC